MPSLHHNYIFLALASPQSTSTTMLLNVQLTFPFPQQLRRFTKNNKKQERRLKKFLCYKEELYPSPNVFCHQANHSFFMFRRNALLSYIPLIQYI
jgi:hypothetical protein